MWDNNEMAWDPVDVICTDMVDLGLSDMLKSFMNDNNFTFSQWGIDDPITPNNIEDDNDDEEKSNEGSEDNKDEEKQCQQDSNEESDEEEEICQQDRTILVQLVD